MPEQREVAETVQNHTLQNIEESLQKLWEKAHAVSDLLVRLKNENKELRMQIESLTEKDRAHEAELQRRAQEIEHLRAQLAEVQSQGQALIVKEEQEELKAKLKELIAKINSHL